MQVELSASKKFSSQGAGASTPIPHGEQACPDSLSDSGIRVHLAEQPVHQDAATRCDQSNGSDTTTEEGLALPACKKPLVDSQITRPEAKEDNLLQGSYALDEVHDLTDGDPRRKVDRVSVDARADARKGNALDTLRRGNRQGTPVAGRQQGRLPLCAAAPDRPNRLDDERRRQPVAFGRLGIPRLAAPSRRHS